MVHNNVESCSPLNKKIFSTFKDKISSSWPSTTSISSSNPLQLILERLKVMQGIGCWIAGQKNLIDRSSASVFPTTEAALLQDLPHQSSTTDILLKAEEWLD